ncbi:MAG: thiamine-phosphate kinase [Chloroflexi bacterium]|nr:thiamine-phosphate kinase [Chloroflexota bacterium]
MVSEPTVADIGEFGLIARLKERFNRAGAGVVRGIGDDTAVLQITPGWLLLATTDAAVEGTHFTRATTTPHTLGRRVLAVNLSDIAAMGGLPRWALISLSLPDQTPLRFVEELADGLSEEAARYQMAIVGGNLARCPDRMVFDVTLLGDVEPDRVLYRNGARPGDHVLVTGTLGDSAAGLAVLLGQIPSEAQGVDYLLNRHRLPTPRIEAGRAIAQSGLASAMLDLSDGLASDIGHLADDSQVGAIVDAEHVPLSPEIQALAAAANYDPLDWALRGGEDYELLLTAPPERVPGLITVVQATGVRLTDIGEITATTGTWLRRAPGQIEPLGRVHWQHFGQ